MAQQIENPTLADIARHTGVSLMTVSRTVRGLGRISASTRKRVLAAANELGYRPNHAARATAVGRFNAVTIVLSTSARRSNLPRYVLDGIHDELARHRLHLNFAIVPDDQLSDQQVVPELLRQTMSDGLLLNYTDNLPPNLAELIDRYHLPAVWINHKQATDAVYPDDYGAARDIIRRLHGLGHRRIAYSDLTWWLPGQGEKPHYSNVDRHDGYLAAMADFGLEPMVLREAIASGDRRARVEAFLKVNRPTALFGYSPLDGAAFAYAGAFMGLEVPRDLSIATIESRSWPYLGYATATQVIQEKQIGTLAAQMLIRKITSPGHETSVAVPMVWEPGDSTAALSS